MYYIKNKQRVNISILLFVYFFVTVHTIKIFIVKINFKDYFNKNLEFNTLKKLINYYSMNNNYFYVINNLLHLLSLTYFLCSWMCMFIYIFLYFHLGIAYILVLKIYLSAQALFVLTLNLLHFVISVLQNECLNTCGVISFVMCACSFIIFYNFPESLTC